MHGRPARGIRWPTHYSRCSRGFVVRHSVCLISKICQPVAGPHLLHTHPEARVGYADHILQFTKMLHDAGGMRGLNGQCHATRAGSLAASDGQCAKREAASIEMRNGTSDGTRSIVDHGDDGVLGHVMMCEGEEAGDWQGSELE